MKAFERILLFFILPIVAVLSFPPATLQNASVLMVGLALALFVGLGVLLWYGYSLMLTLTIFIQGMNVIIRLMMFFPNAVDKTTGAYNPMFIVTILFGLVLSFYLMLRLDRLDVRATMVR